MSRFCHTPPAVSWCPNCKKALHSIMEKNKEIRAKKDEKTRKVLKKFKITSKATVLLTQVIYAENADQAEELWEKSDPSLDKIDESSIDNIEFVKCEQL